jgi:hypothetical protein
MAVIVHNVLPTLAVWALILYAAFWLYRSKWK